MAYTFDELNENRQNKKKREYIPRYPHPNPGSGITDVTPPLGEEPTPTYNDAQTPEARAAYENWYKNQSTAVLGDIGGGSTNTHVPSAPNGTPPPPAVAGEMSPAEKAAIDERNLSGVEIGNTEYSTRTVQDNELVGDHLSKLLDGNSSYILNARRRGAELSNRRGQFTSNLFAGASERAAIEASMPIATADAQAYRDAAGQNLAARNQNAIANIQRASSLDTALLGSRTSIAMANLDASLRVGEANLRALTSVDIANLDSATRTNVTRMQSATQLLIQGMQSDLEKTLQSRNISHERAVEKFRQDGRMDLAKLDSDLRLELQERGFANDFSLQELSGEQALTLNTLVQEYDLEKQMRDQGFNNRQSHIAMAMQAQVNYTNFMSSFANVEMDENAAARVQEQATNQLLSSYALINGLYPDQPPITIEFGGG